MMLQQPTQRHPPLQQPPPPASHQHQPYDHHHHHPQQQHIIHRNNGNQHHTTGGGYYHISDPASDRRSPTNSSGGVYGPMGYPNNSYDDHPSASKRPRVNSTTSSSGGSSSTYDRNSSPMARIPAYHHSIGPTPPPPPIPFNRNMSSTTSQSPSYLPTLESLPYSGNGNTGGGNGGGGGYLSLQSPTVDDSDNPLPDFNTEWFVPRLSVPGATPTPAGPSPAIPAGISSSNATSNRNMGHPTINTSNLSGTPGSDMDVATTPVGSNGRLLPELGLVSPTGGIFGVNGFIPDYETGFYSLWNGSNGANVMGYDADTDQRQPSHGSSVGGNGAGGSSVLGSGSTTPIYLPEDELKLDYPQLPDFNHSVDLDCLYGPIDTGSASPTTPLATISSQGKLGKSEPMSSSAASSTAVTPTERRNLSGRETQLERLLSSSDYLKRERSNEQEISRQSAKNLGNQPSKSATSSTLAVAPRLAFGSTSEGGGNMYRSLARNASLTFDPKRIQSTNNNNNQAGSSGSTYQGAPTTSSIHAATPTATPTGSAHTGARPPGENQGEKQTEHTVTGKRPRSRECDYPGCTNRARSHQKCKKHGGAHQCVFEGCLKNSQSRGLCIAHGGGSRCKIEGCVRAAQSKGLCKSHGGGEFCAVEGCRKKAHLKHLCRTHGGGVRCKYAKCSKWAQRKGWCMAHAKEFLGP